MSPIAEFMKLLVGKHKVKVYPESATHWQIVAARSAF